VVLVSARVGGMAIFSNKFQNLIYVVKLDDNKYFVIPNVFFYPKMIHSMLHNSGWLINHIA